MPTTNDRLTGPQSNNDMGIPWSFVGTATARDYALVLKAPFPFYIDAVASKCASGTSTATVKIDGVALGGAVNSVSSTETSQSHTTANFVDEGADVFATFTAGAVDPQLSLKCRRR